MTGLLKRGDWTPFNTLEEPGSSEARLAAIFAQASVGLSEVSLDGRFLRVNDALCTMLGHTGEALLRLRVADVTHPDDLSSSRAALGRVLETGEAVSVDKRYLRPDRSVVWANSILSRLDDEQGRPRAVLAVTINLTERRGAEAALRESESHLRTLVQNVRDYAIFMTDPRGVITEWTEGAERVTGFTAAEVVGRHASLLHTPEDQAAGEVDREIRQATVEGRAEREAWRVRKGGERFWANEISTAVHAADGQLLGFTRISRDLTERKRAEAERAMLLESERTARGEAERANRMKDEFLACISHELATPLLAMRVWLDVLASGEGVRQPAAFEALRQCTSAQTKLVNDLLDTVRALTGKLNVTLGPCAVMAPVDAAVAGMQPVAASKGVTLEVVSRDDGQVNADPTRVAQIVTNLLSNAIKFTSPGGRVEVRIELRGDKMAIVVRDSGRGYPPEFQPLLFQPFRQEEEGTTRSSGGLGLGLAIIKQLVELHQGKVTGESAGRGLGATFTVLLPVFSEAREDLPAPGSPSLQRPLDGVAVLLVEDDELARGAVASVLEQHGARVHDVEDATSALLLLHDEVPDVLLCDIAMPDEDGYSFIRKVREIGGAAARMPAAALTAHMREEDRSRALSAGFQMHIPKSVDTVQLVMLVRALAARPET